MAYHPSGDCATCDHNYRYLFNDLIKPTSPLYGKLGIYDIDLVVEREGEIKYIVEYKKYKEVFSKFFIPSFEYVAQKKIGKRLRVPPYIIFDIVGKDEFWLFPIDRFEMRREFVKHKGRSFATFSQNEGHQLSKEQLLEALLAATEGERGYF